MILWISPGRAWGSFFLPVEDMWINRLVDVYEKRINPDIRYSMKD